jgi:hypothetical protein
MNLIGKQVPPDKILTLGNTQKKKYEAKTTLEENSRFRFYTKSEL